MSLEIVDDQGVIFSGSEEFVMEKWHDMDNSMSGVTSKGNVKLIEVMGVWE